MKRLKRSHWLLNPINPEFVLMDGKFIYHDFMSSRCTGMIGII